MSLASLFTPVTMQPFVNQMKKKYQVGDVPNNIVNPLQSLQNKKTQNILPSYQLSKMANTATTYTAPQSKATQQQLNSVRQQSTQPVQKPFQPTTTTQQTNQFDKLFAPIEQRKQQLGTTLNKNTELTKKYYDLNRGILESQIPVAQGAYDQYKTDTQADIEAQKRGGVEQKATAETEWGTAQRQAAMTRNESDARIRNKYAAQGSLDSYGAGSYRQASADLENQFNTFTQQGIQNKLKQFNEIDNKVADFERQATSLIRQEQLKLNQQIQQIKASVDMNDIEKEQSILELQSGFDEAINQLDDYYMELSMQRDQLQKTIDEDNALIAQLSPEFKVSGQPTNNADFMYINKYPNEYEALLKGVETNTKTNETTALQEKGDTISLIDKILSSDTNPLTGNVALQGGVNPWKRVEVADTKANIQKLQAQLELASAGKLKGQGAVSEAEREILKRASIALAGRANGTYNVSDEQLRSELSTAKQILERGGAASTGVYGNNQQTIRVKEIASGQTGTIPVNEFNPSLYERI